MQYELDFASSSAIYLKKKKIGNAHILAQINSFQVSLANITHMEKSFKRKKVIIPIPPHPRLDWGPHKVTLMKAQMLSNWYTLIKSIYI